MQVQINTDDNIQADESLVAWAESELTKKLERHRDHITRVEVHLSDASATRRGINDKRCMLEARLSGRPPVAVSHEAEKIADALFGAADKLMRKLDTALGRARDANGRQSIRGATPD